jgi:hypothetical protein
LKDREDVGFFVLNRHRTSFHKIRIVTRQSEDVMPRKKAAPEPIQEGLDPNLADPNQDPAGDPPVDPIEQLRAELRSEFETQREKEKAEYEKRLREQELQYQRKMTERASEVGNYRKFFNEFEARQAAQAPKETPKRISLTPVDPIRDDEGFRQWQQSVFETVQNLQEQLTEAKKGGSSMEELKALKEELAELRYAQYASSEETTLRDEYGLDNDTLDEVKNFGRSAGILSLSGAAFAMPHVRKIIEKNISDKSRTLLPNNGNGNGYEDSDEKARAAQARKEALKKEIEDTKKLKTPSKSAGRREEDDLTFFEEVKAAASDGSFFKWPKEKQERGWAMINQEAAKKAL